MLCVATVDGHSKPGLLGSRLCCKITLPVGVGKVAYGAGVEASSVIQQQNTGSFYSCTDAMLALHLQAVWASKYNERAYYSTRKVGINFEDVRMAVLTQVMTLLAKPRHLCVHFLCCCICQCGRRAAAVW